MQEKNSVFSTKKLEKKAFPNFLFMIRFDCYFFVLLSFFIFLDFLHAYFYLLHSHLLQLKLRIYFFILKNIKYMIKAYIIITKSLYFYNSQLKKYNSGLIFKFYLITYNIIGDVF